MILPMNRMGIFPNFSVSCRGGKFWYIFYHGVKGMISSLDFRDM